MTNDINSKIIETDLIETAVKFLQNPSIINNPFQEKKNFLKRKGLTDEQIQIAFEKSGSLDIALQSINNNHFYSSNINPTRNSFLANFRNKIYSAVFIGSVLYGLYLLYKNFIKTYFSNKNDKDDINNEIRHFSSSNNNQIAQLTESLVEFQTQLNLVSTRVEQLNFSLENSKSFNQKFKEIKDEINTIKGLLLNRKQFPKIPVNNNTIPSMPDWQLESVKEKSHTAEVDSENGNQLSKKSSFDSSGSSEDIEAHTKHSDSSIEIF